MKNYLELLQDVLDNGTYAEDRTGTGTYSVLGRQLRFDLSEGFPIVTTKRTHFHSIVHELLWFISGDTNVQYLQDNKVRIWDAWAPKEDVFELVEMEPHERLDFLSNMEDDEGRYAKVQSIKRMGLEEGMITLDGYGVPRERKRIIKKKGELGPVYGKQWCRWTTPEGRTINQLAEAIRLIKEDPTSRRIIVNAWNVSDLPDMALPPCHLMFQFYVREGKLSCMFTQR